MFHFKPICVNEVAASLALLNTHKSTGVDGISSHLLRTVAGALSPSITKLFNASLLQGQIPSEWKQANVTPIPKTSNSKSPSNFRPISVLPVLAKIFESFIHQQIYSYLTAHSLLHPCQSGFQPSHSTQDTLLKTVDDWRIALDRGEYVGAILIDLSKAFDSIDHAILLSKLSAYGLIDTELNWFKDYLTGRMQRVCVESTFSNWTTIGTFHVNSTQKNEHPLRFQRNLVYTYLTISYITIPNFSPICRMASYLRALENSPKLKYFGDPPTLLRA